MAEDQGGARKVIIFGASGSTGRCVVEEALNHGWDATAFTSRPDDFPIARERLRLSRGDVMDAAAVEAAVAGQHAVLSAIEQTEGSPRDLLAVAGRNIVAAMKKHGTRRLVTLLVAAVRVPGDEEPGFGLKMMGDLLKLASAPLVEDSQRHARIVLNSGLDYVIVRPMRIVDGPKLGHLRAAPFLRLSMEARITRADLAEFMIRQVTSGEFLQKAPMVAFDEKPPAPRPG